MNRQEVIKYCLKLKDTFEDYPFKDDNESVTLKHRKNKKWFALIMNVKQKVYLNVKTNPEYSDLLRNSYSYIIPAYLWKDTPETAVFRHEDTHKWFAIIMKVKNEEYFNVKTEPNYSDLLRNTYDYIIPAYHMNKEHWNTIILSDDCDEGLVKELLKQSYDLTKK